MKFSHCLAAFFAVTLSCPAATTVLYQTGWEASPATPAWALANLLPQNSWAGAPATSNDRNKIVANGSGDANPFGTPVVAPTGNQFHRFRASTSTTTANPTWVWADVTGPFNSRPTGSDLITSSIDVFVPTGDASDRSIYGLFIYDDAADGSGNFLDYGFLISPLARQIALVIDGANVAFSPTEFIPYDTWFNLAIKANYQNGDVEVFYNNTAVPSLAQNTEYIIDSTLTDVDLFCQNATNLPSSRIIYTDNYRVTAEALAPVLPTLTITSLPPDAWVLSWSAAYSDWILETTDNIASLTWDEVGNPVNIVGANAYVEVAEFPPGRFFRLRQP